MAKQEYDFVGWATKNDIKCSDGRIIRHNAFADNDGKRVPLVWNHNHSDIDNVLGYVVLKNQNNGVRGYGYFNSTDKGRNAKTILEHGDITSLSIYANKLKQVGGDVIHGDIKEVSLVLAGANPGAYIDEIRHGEESVLDAIVLSTGDEVIIEHGEIDEDTTEIITSEVGIESIEHADKEEKAVKVEKNEEEPEDEPEEELDNKKEGKEVPVEKDEKTVQDVIDSMTEEQKNVMYALVGMAAENGKGGSNEDEEDGGDEDMKHNFFANEEDYQEELIHGEILDALNDAKRYGSVKESMLAHNLDPEEVLVHGIENVDYLFPDYKNVRSDVPFINTQPNGWISVVNNGVHHTPFARVKMLFADITPAEARAKGYTKGAKKIDEVFKLLRRSVDPTTIYKKQSFDRDDVVDITDIDAIAWVKKEMRIKLDEERARAYIFGDGRSASDADKIDESKIIPVVKDTENNLYAMAVEVAPAAGEDLAHAIINGLVKGLDNYEGSGNITALIRSDIVSDMMLMEDKIGQRMYKTLNELAGAMGVDRVVKVPASVVPEGIYGVALDLNDYNVGANRGGEVSLFDDFDIDYNKMKYLIETRCSGALIMPHSALVLKEKEGSNANAPVQNLDGEVDDEF